MTLQRPPRREAQSGLAAVVDHSVYFANDRTTMAHRVAVGYLLVFMGLHEQTSPGPAKDGLQIGFDVRALRGIEPSID